MKFKLLYDKIDMFIYNLGYSLLGSYFERKQIKEKQLKIVDKEIKLTNKQKNKIDEFYKENYGKKIPYDWHKYYQLFTGNYDEKYFPELLYIPNFELKMNPKSYCKVFWDKNIQELLTKNTNVKVAKNIVSQSNGIYRDENNNIINYQEVKKILNNYKREMFIKPSKDSSSGKNCFLIEINKDKDIRTGKNLEELLSVYDGNFCIQKRLENTYLLSQLHPESINTFRVMTYIWEGKLFHCPLVIRIGQGKSNIDNGNLFIGVKDSGELCDKAFEITKSGKEYEKHPDTGIKFKGYKIPQVKNIIQAAYKLHSNIVQIGIISWDLALNEKDEVVLIEANTYGGSIWMPQITHGCGAFGENTASILKWISKN